MLLPTVHSAHIVHASVSTCWQLYLLGCYARVWMVLMGCQVRVGHQEDRDQSADLG